MPAPRSRLTSILLDGHAAELLVATEPDARFAPHWHEAWSVGTIVAGTCRFACDGQSYEANESDIVVMPPFAVHTAGVSAVRFEMVMLYLQPAWVGRLMNWPGQQWPVGMAVVRRDDELSGMLPRAVQAGVSAGIRDAVMKALQRASPEKIEFTMAASFEPRIRALCDALQADDPQLPDMASVARRVGVSREHFQRLFRKAIGLTPLEYGRLARMSRAKRLLLDGSTLSQAAVECGFADQAHFSRWFRRYFGVSPAAYRADS